MSFLTLFAAGKGVIGMGDKNSPYRMRAANLLPKFESPKNPFAPKAPVQTPELIPVAAVAKPEEIVAKAKPAVMETASLFDSVSKPTVILTPVEQPAKPVEVVQASLPVVEKTKTEKLPFLPKTRVVAKVAKPTQPEIPVVAPAKVSAVKSGGSFLKWIKKIKPLAYLPDLKGAKAKPIVRPKQTELSLEKVKVMRNHLNDADLEIKGGKLLEKKFVLAAKLQPLASAQNKTLDRLTTRFFGPSSNQLQTHAQCQITTTIQ